MNQEQKTEKCADIYNSILCGNKREAYEMMEAFGSMKDFVIEYKHYITEVCEPNDYYAQFTFYQYAIEIYFTYKEHLQETGD